MKFIFVFLLIFFSLKSESIEKKFFENDLYIANLNLNYVKGDFFITEAFVTFVFKTPKEYKYLYQVLSVDCSNQKIQVTEELISKEKYGQGDKSNNKQILDRYNNSIYYSYQYLFSEICI